jgi:NitT/TauT family transport system substrate-binding protein
MKGSKYFYPLLLLFSLAVIWEIASLSFEHLSFILPPVSKILVNIFLHPNNYLVHLLVTTNEILWALGIAFVISFPTAWLMHHYKSANATLQPIFVAIQCIPMFTLAPLMIIWVGWNVSAIIIPTVLMIFFPLTLNIYQGLRSTPKSLLDFFASNQASQWQIFFKLRLPWALPHTFAGLRVASAVAGISTVAGEWAGGQQGLGVLIHESRYSADIVVTFGALFCLAILSLSFYGAVSAMEKAWTTPRKKKLTFNKSIYGWVVIPILVMFFHACQPPEPTNVIPTTLILDWFPNVNHTPLYIGIDRGFFEEHGINLKILKLRDPADTIPYVTSGQASLGIYYMPHAIKAATKKAPDFRVIGYLMKRPLEVLLFRTDSKIKSQLDMRNKVIGYPYDGYFLSRINASLQENGIPPMISRKVTFDIVTSLATKMIDISMGAYWNIESAHLKYLGIDTEYMEFTEFGIPNYYELIILANKPFIEKHPQFVENFRKALQKSIRFCKRNPKMAFKIYSRSNRDKSTTTLAWEQEAWKNTVPLMTDDQKGDIESWEKFTQWMVEQKLIESPPAPSEYVIQ